MAEHLDERGEPESATHNAIRSEFSAREARQAGMGKRIFLVLTASLALALLVWAALEWSQSEGNQTGSIENTQPVPLEQPATEQPPNSESKKGMAPTDRNPTPQSGTGAPRENTAPDDTNG